MNIAHLFWIVPVSMIIGSIATVVIACALNAGDITREEEKRNENQTVDND